MAKILLVEDERNFALVLKDYLVMNGHEVVLAAHGEEGLRCFEEFKFDLCLLDVMMPRKDGFTLAIEIRAADPHIPLLFLTARGQREDQIRGYRAGADDYIVKPFDSEVLLLKMKAMLGRRESHATQEQFQFGRFTFQPRLRLLKERDGSETRLSPREASLLELLCRHRDDVLPRARALKLIWKEDTYFNGRSMDVYIARLRKRLAADPALEIVNLHGDGYSLRTL
jgi:two-component system OmpR family response regulator